MKFAAKSIVFIGTIAALLCTTACTGGRDSDPNGSTTSGATTGTSSANSADSNTSGSSQPTASSSDTMGGSGRGPASTSPTPRGAR